jgi:TonB family protein
MHIESNVLDDDFDFFEFDPSQPYQVSIDSNGIPFAVVEEVPIFPGCEDAADPRDCFREKIHKHISRHFRYPDEAQKQGIQGRVSVMFTIDEQGNIVNIRKRGPHEILEAETVRIIEKLPQMQPGKSGGKAVRVPFSIPINYKLEQAGFNPHSQDANYVKLQQEQISEMSDKIQIEYRDAIPFSEVENVPVFPGCEGASDARACFQEKIQRHISKNFKYPEEAQEKGIQGRVSILFLIDAEGNVTNIAKRGADKSLEDEAVRIISRMPKLKPGSQNGKNVAVPFAIPITFKLK